MPNIKNSPERVKKICFVATVPFAVHAFLRPHINFLSRQYDITVICNNENKSFLKGVKARFFYLNIERKPSLIKDIVFLLNLILLFKKNKFDLVHTIMPKSGLVGMLAAFLCGIKIRIHTFTGQVWVTKRGIIKKFLKFTDFLTAFFATHLLADSFGQRRFLINNKIVFPEKIDVLSYGSIAGVALKKFSRDKLKRYLIRKKLQIKRSDVVFTFIGRLNIDKGILDLLNAFEQISPEYQNAHLFLIGTIEVSFLNIIKQKIKNPKIHYFPYCLSPQNYLSASDIFCLPSYREGFPNVIIEAASVGLPSIASNIYGISDFVIHKQTGLLHKPFNIKEIVKCMRLLIDNASFREKLGNEAKNRVAKYFDQKDLVYQLNLFYLKQMNR